VGSVDRDVDRRRVLTGGDGDTIRDDRIESAAVTTTNFCPEGGEKPLAKFSWSVPPRVARPATLRKA
jgi:hypothetical protein